MGTLRLSLDRPCVSSAVLDQQKFRLNLHPRFRGHGVFDANDAGVGDDLPGYGEFMVRQGGSEKLARVHRLLAGEGQNDRVARSREVTLAQFLSLWRSSSACPRAMSMSAESSGSQGLR